MNNEPVAWMYEYGTDRGDAVNGISWYPNVRFKKPDLGSLVRNIEPLYTHPADESFDRTASHMAGEYVSYPAKTLTDEEINQLWAESHEDGIAIQQGFTTQQHYFARAILKKASEK
jgi:hypothetical protein